jgi:teichuronic acid biosynthesis glycosyltransferase TuaG
MVLDSKLIGEFAFPRNYKLLHEDFCAWMSLIRRGHLGHRLPADLGRYRLSPQSRSANKLNGAYNTWLIYRQISQLPLLRAAIWWLLYAWNGFWLYRTARPR